MASWLFGSTDGSSTQTGPPVIAWCAEATNTIFWLPGIGFAWNVQCGFGVALPQTAMGLLPSGRADQRFWWVTASRSM